MHTPYITRHIALHEAASPMPLRTEPGYAYYLVFWWYSIPLGHLYVEQGGMPEALLLAKIKAAILPAVTQYARCSGQVAAVTGWSGQEAPAFFRALSGVLDAFTTKQDAFFSDISVVVCTRNRAPQLRQVLEDLGRQECRPREVIVVDNAPSDNSTRRLVAAFPNVRYLPEFRQGLDIARNTGAAVAAGSVVAYTDDDVVLPAFWISRLWEAFRDPGVQALTGLILAQEQETESEQLFEKYWSFNRGYQDRVYGTDFIRMPAPKVWEIGAGANMAFRKSLLEQVGYFDERLDAGAAGCSGDSELWFRILKAGFPIHYNPRVVLHHRHRNTLSGLHQQLFQYMRGHVVAALIQHEQDPQAGYRKYVYKDLPIYYLRLLKAGLPAYGSRFQTLWSEIRGMASGLRYYRKVRMMPAFSLTPSTAEAYERP